MTLNHAMRVSATGLTAERFRLDVIAANVANANSSAPRADQVYRRRSVMLEGTEDGVAIREIVEDQSALPMRHEPGNPNADPQTGLVVTSNIQPVFEMVDMMSAQRAYEANISAFNTAKGMIESALNIGKV